MRVLVGVDFSECSQLALEEVARRPWPAQSELRVITVVEPLDVASTGTFVPQILEAKTEAARARVESAASTLAGHGLPVSSRVVTGSPHMALNDEATLWGAELVVVGSRGYGAFRRLLLGSVASAVVRGATCSVEIVRGAAGSRKSRPGEKIILAVDGSACSLDAVRSVVSRPWPDATQLRLVSVAPSPAVLAGAWAVPEAASDELQRASRRTAQEAIEAARTIVREAGMPASAQLLDGDPRSCLVEECREWEADLLVVGSHGRRGLDRLFFGSVSEAVAIHAPCSVVVIRTPLRARAAD